MPLSTTSASTAAILVEASGPAMISGRYPARPGRPGGVVDQLLEAAGVTLARCPLRRPRVDRLPCQEFQVAASGAERHHLKKVRGAVDDVNRLGADGTGGSEEDDSARLARC